MSKPSQASRHPLSERHFKQIICRDGSRTHRMRSIWGVTWRPGDQTGHFLGKLFRPLGAAAMMVQVPYHRDHPRPEKQHGIGLFGVTALIDAATATVSYSEVRLRHEFHFVPRVGGRRTVLDPSEGRGGNASWVQLALEVDHVRQRAAERNFLLQAVPQMPAVYFGYATREAALNKFAETAALRQLAAGSVEINWEGNSLGQLMSFVSESSAARETIFNSWSAEEREVKLRAAWESAIIAPSVANNTTGFWLMPHELINSVYGATRIFEYFGGLTGAHVFNPARKMSGKSVPNPAIEVAKAVGIDLVEVLDKVAELPAEDPVYKEIEQQLIGLIPGYRKVLGASTDVSDEDLMHSLCAYAEPVMIEPPVGKLPEAAQIAEVRNRLRPHISEACTDGDVLEAATNPNSPLFASGLARIQVLRRDARVAPADSMYFSPLALGRERVEATFWYDLPQPMPAHRKALCHESAPAA